MGKSCSIATLLLLRCNTVREEYSFLLYRIILSTKMSTSTIKHLKLFMLQFILIYL